MVVDAAIAVFGDFSRCLLSSPKMGRVYKPRLTPYTEPVEGFLGTCLPWAGHMAALGACGSFAAPGRFRGACGSLGQLVEDAYFPHLKGEMARR